MTCRHFTEIGARCCAAGVDYQQLAGGGTFTLVLRLPCLPITNRRGEEVRQCKLQQPGEHDEMPTV